MKVGLTGHYHEDFKQFLIDEKGFEIDNSSCPDLMLVYGGDGSLLGAEREYPHIPKFPIRDIKTAPLCAKHSHHNQLDLLRTSQLEKFQLTKISAVINNQEVIGINDIFIHNANRVSAVRYKVWIDDEIYAEEIVGDGVGVSTPFGSSAYYRSITHSIFRVGLGLAFSNSTEAIDHLVLPETSIIKIEIIRGPALVVADNYQRHTLLNEGDCVTIKKTTKNAIIYGLNIFMCKDCRTLRLSRQCKFLRDGQTDAR